MTTDPKPVPTAIQTLLHRLKKGRNTRQKGAFGGRAKVNRKLRVN